MNEVDKSTRAALIAEAIVGAEEKDALDIIGEGLSIAAKSGKCDFAPILPIWYIAKLVSECNGEKATVKIKKDGGVQFTIQSGKEKKMEI